MRKISILTILTIALLTVSVVTLNSCKKEESNETFNQTENDDWKVAFERMENFKQKIDYIKENPLYKSGESMSKEDMVWNLNTTLNFEHALIDDMYDDFYVESTQIDVPVTDGNINLDDVAIAYQQLETDIANAVSDAPFSDKQLNLSYVAIEEETDQTLTLKSTISVGEKIDPIEKLPFVQGDDFFWGELIGLCENPGGEYDAADTIAEFTNVYRPFHIDDTVGCNIYFYYNFVDVIIEFDDVVDPLKADLFDLTNGQGYDNTRDFRLFYASDAHCPNGTTLNDFMCIEQDDMNFYYTQMETLIYDLLPDPYENKHYPQAHNKYFVTPIVMYGQMSSSIIYHKAEIIFASRAMYQPCD